jgi:hypothetical protein
MADDSSPLSGSLNSAFADLSASVSKHLGPLTTAKPVDPLSSRGPAIIAAIDAMDFEPDDSPQRTAENTEAMTQHLAALTAVMREQAVLVSQQVELSKETLATAEQAERRANRIGWISLAVAVASLSAAVAALFVAG